MADEPLVGDAGHEAWARPTVDLTPELEDAPRAAPEAPSVDAEE